MNIEYICSDDKIKGVEIALHIKKSLLGQARLLGIYGEKQD